MSKGALGGEQSCSDRSLWIISFRIVLIFSVRWNMSKDREKRWQAEERQNDIKKKVEVNSKIPRGKKMKV